MRTAISLEFSPLPWAVFSGSWIAERLCSKVNRIVYDGAPIVVGEPVADVEVDDVDKLRSVVNELSRSISYSTITSWTRLMVGGRVFVALSAIPGDMDNALRSLMCGGLDGVVPDVRAEIAVKDVNVISVCRDETREPCYAHVRLHELSNLRELASKYKVYGVIISTPGRISASVALEARSRALSMSNAKEVLIEMPHLLLRPTYLRSLRGVVDGVVISSLGNIVKLALSDQEMRNVYRCVKCYVDYVSRESMRKCPRCASRLTSLVRDASTLRAYGLRELRLIGLEFLRNMRTSRPKVVYG